MNICSFEFLIFFLILVGILIRVKDIKLQNNVLLFASYIFYMLNDARFFVILLLVSIASWYLGKKISNAYSRLNARRYLFIALIIDLLVLGMFKYYNFFIESFSNALGIKVHIAEILIPFGISFYIFQAISYIADVYNGKIKADGVFEVLLYVGFFPQIMSGPIVKAYEFMPQLRSKRCITKERFSCGVQRIAVGTFKKAVIANRLGVCVDSVYAAPLAYSGLSLLIAAISYSLQIYYDFSGYSDMAIGIAHILGFDYKENFELPYLAENPSGFWQRWHISLSSWFKEYVYIPLGGNRKGTVNTYKNLFVTMILSGLWHGASVAFLLWGILHAIGSIIHKAYFEYRIRHCNISNSVKKMFSILGMFAITTFLWIPFRTNSITNFVLIVKRIFLWSEGINYVYAYTIVFLIFLSVIQCVSSIKNNGKNIWRPLDLSLFRNKVIFMCFIIFIASFAYVGNGAFIYAQF